MSITQSRPKLKQSGARYKSYRGKRIYEMGRESTMPKIGETKRVSLKTKAAGTKTILLRANIANVLDPKTRKCEKVKIITVVGNPANRHFIRRNILTKGTIIETEKGKARITSRPGQEGMVNAVFVS